MLSITEYIIEPRNLYPANEWKADNVVVAAVGLIASEFSSDAFSIVLPLSLPLISAS